MRRFHIASWAKPRIDFTGCVLYAPLWRADLAIAPAGTFQSKDLSPKTGTVTGATYGKYGRSFDGTDDEITLNSTALDFTTQSFTLEAWAKFNSLVGGPGIIAKSTSTELVGYEFYVQGNGSLTFATCQTPSAQQYSYTAASAITTGIWFHCLATRSGAVGKTFVNGVDLTNTSGTHINPTDPSAQLLRIGSVGGSQDLDGFIGEVRIYNRALAAAEVMHNYQVTKWRYLS